MRKNQITTFLFKLGLLFLLPIFRIIPAHADLIWPIVEFPDGIKTPEGTKLPEEPMSPEIDYLVLMNKLNPLPDNWASAVEFEHITNSRGNTAEVEKKAYEAYLALRNALAAEEVIIDIDSAYRSITDQMQIMEDFTIRYGEDYAKKFVAVPGYSEHHTGLALDLYLNVDGVDIYDNEEMVKYPEIWAKIHEKLADFGFILRYPEGKEDITGFSYEPWHIRYIDNVEAAKKITEQGLTLEEYLF